MAGVLWQPGHRNYWKSNFLKDLSDNAIDTLLAHFGRVPPPRRVVVVDHNGGGAISRVARNEITYGHREWTYNLLVTSAWAKPEDTGRNISWTREMW